MAAKTIFALSSGPGPCGVAVIRVSGERVRDVVQAVSGAPCPAPRVASLRRLFTPGTAEVFDTGLVLFFPAPHSFTGEDVAEFHLHGSLASIRAFSGILGAMDAVAPADAGEFTARAFTNGKVDLLAVEALGDLLASETIEQARFAQRALLGLRKAADSWRAELIELLALTEASIDFSDEDDVVRHIDSSTEQKCGALVASLERVIGSYRIGERLRHGFRIALCGAPNAGKSTLLNALAQRDVAIVSPLAGTTRDVIEVHLDLGGYPVIVSDTAGIRETDDMIEAQGVERAQQAAANADLVLWLSPADAQADPEIAGALVVRTKCDLGDPQRMDSATQRNIYAAISVRTGEGLSHLLERLQGDVSKHLSGGGEGLIIAHERQLRALKDARDALIRASDISSDWLELRAEEIRQGIRSLDRLVGRVDCEEILGAIFSRFCIGK